MDPVIEKRKDKILKIRLKYATEVEGLECPFVWHFYKLFDEIEFSKFVQNTTSIDDLSLNLDDDSLTEYSDQIVKIYSHFIMNGYQFALDEVSLYFRKLSECSSGPDGDAKKVLIFVAKSCEIFLQLLSGNRDEAVKLKQTLDPPMTNKEKGHLKGVHGLIAVRFNETKYAQPFLRDALNTTGYHEYAFDLGKTIARLRRLQSSFDVTDEEVALFERVAKHHTYAIPQLLDSLGSKIQGLKQSKHYDKMKAVQNKHNQLLSDAWLKRHSFHAKGLTRLADAFSRKRDYAKTEELYSMAYKKLPNCPYNLHKYGVFLTRYKPDKTIRDVAKGVDFFARAKHAPAFISLIEIYFGKPLGVATKELNPFEDYLASFVSNATSKSDKQLYTYIAYKYFLDIGDINMAISYLKLGIAVDPKDLTFELKTKPYEKKTLSYCWKKISIPRNVDLSYEAGYITDENRPFETSAPQSSVFEAVDSFKNWWKEQPDLKEMDQYPGYKEYHAKHKSSGWRSQRSGSRDDSNYEDKFNFSGAGYKRREGSYTKRDEQKSSSSKTGGAGYKRREGSYTKRDEQKSSSSETAPLPSKIPNNETIQDERTAALRPMKKELDLLQKNRTMDNTGFLTFIYDSFSPKHKPNADKIKLDMSTENIEAADRAGKMKKMLKTATTHYHPDRINGEEHGYDWKYFCEEITKILTSKYNKIY